MQKRGFGATVTIAALAALLVIGVAVLFFMNNKPQTPSAQMATTPPTNETTLPANSSDQSLNQDTTAIDQQLNGIQTDTSVNDSLNDKPVDLSQ